MLNSRGDAREIIARRAIDIIQPDVTLCGGFAECLFIAELAALWGITCNPHCYGGPIATIATLHLLSLLPEPNLSYTPEVAMLELDAFPARSWIDWCGNRCAPWRPARWPCRPGPV